MALSRISISVHNLEEQQRLTDLKKIIVSESETIRTLISYRDITPVVTHIIDHLKWKTQCVRWNNNALQGRFFLSSQSPCYFYVQ